MNNNPQRQQWLHELGQLTDVKVPLDGMMCAIAGRPEVDVVKWDDAMKRRYAGEYKANESLADFLLRRFGQKAYDMAVLLLAAPED